MVEMFCTTHTLTVIAVRGVTNDSVVDSCLTEVFAPARMESVIANVRTPAGQLAADVTAVCVTGAVGAVGASLASGAALASLLPPPLSLSLPPPQPLMAIAENNAAQISFAIKITPLEKKFYWPTKKWSAGWPRLRTGSSIH